MLFRLNAVQIECCSDWVLFRLISLDSQALTFSLSFCFSLFLFVLCRSFSFSFFSLFLLELYLRSLIYIPCATARIPRVLFHAFSIFALERFAGDVQVWLPLCTIQARFRSASFTSSGDVFLPWCPSNYLLERFSKISLREIGSIAARFLPRADVRLFWLLI